MAKKAAAAAASVPLKLQGKSVYLAGNFWIAGERWKSLVPAEGGTVADELTDKVDYMILGFSAVANPQKKATKLNAQGAGIQVLTEEQFSKTIQPTSDEAEALLKGGEIERWNLLRGHKRRWGSAGRGSHVAVTHADLRGTNLAGADLAHFEQCDFRDADLSRCTLQFAKCDLTGAKVKQAKILRIDECEASRVDFSDSEMLNARFNDSILVGSRFAGMKLSARFDDCKLERADFSNVTKDDADFTSCSLVGADFTRSNLESSDFQDSDLSGAKFAGANLTMANFAGTKVDGADFTGATLVGAEIGGVDFSKAKGYDPAQAQTKGAAGTAVAEFLKEALKAERVNTTLNVTRGNDSALLTVLVLPQWTQCHDQAGTWLHSNQSLSHTPTYIWSQLVTKWHSATPDLGSLAVRATKPAIAAKDLKQLALKAWCELFGIDAPTEEDLKKAAKESKAKKTESAEEWVAVLKSGKKGIERWNADCKKNCKLIDKVSGIDLAQAKLMGLAVHGVEWKEADFSGADLTGCDFTHCDFPAGKFASADLTRAKLSSVRAADADFSKATLAGAELRGVSLKGADCTGAKFTKADLQHANLCGANFTGADLADANLAQASYDENTRWPKKFSPTLEMIWKGPGTSPAAHALVKSTKPKGKLDIDQFMKRLEELTDAAKLSKALKMLKADRFRLYAQTADDHFVGVVKSQGDPDLVYSCRLNADGTYACCTQNLNICGGLRGSLCKHLLVLVVGLSKTGDLDPNAIDTWIRLSKTYKGAEAGEVDWRPTETIPEDYYAM
jgi:uncharacterized protein YjbI with pentapeptide repeats